MHASYNTKPHNLVGHSHYLHTYVNSPVLIHAVWVFFFIAKFSVPRDWSSWQEAHRRNAHAPHPAGHSLSFYKY